MTELERHLFCALEKLSMQYDRDMELLREQVMALTHAVSNLTKPADQHHQSKPGYKL